MADIVVGQQVLVNNKYKAVVKYVGPTSFAEGVWFGLELEREIGKHEGTVLGVTYFSAAKKRGTFVKRENITLYDASTEAAAAIQSQMRGALAKKKVKAELAWRTFNALDANDEAQSLQRQARLVGTALGNQLTRDRPGADLLDQWEAEANALPLPAGYDGPKVTFPLTQDGLWQLMQAVREGKPLHYKYALSILNAYRRYAGALPTLVEVAVQPGERMTVCGDTHGQLQDLLAILTMNGIPTQTNRYLWNGDFVDRGDYGCEIVLLLMAYCLLYPGELKGGTLHGAACLLNRGNHETHAQNVTNGFLTEVLNKYATGGLATFQGESLGGDSAEGGAKRGEDSPAPVMDRALHLYDAFQAAFDAIPLATLVYSAKDPNKRLFTVHGGLLARPGVMLSQIGGIKRKRDIPFGLPGFEDKLFEDLMWSDPRNTQGLVASDRGAGVFFGGDVTAAFCALNRVSLVLRSHECVPEGFSFMHDGRLLTVFSASRYCGRGSNRGAFIVFDSDMAYVVHQYMAEGLKDSNPARLPPTGNLHGLGFEVGTAVATGRLLPAAPEKVALKATLSRGASMASIETRPGSGGGARASSTAMASQAEAVRKMLVERICLRKSDLYFFYSTHDRSPSGARNGCVSKMVWADGMRAVLDLDLPWMSLCPLLATVEPDGRINYTKFLDRYRIAMRSSDLAWIESLTEKLAARLFQATSSLEAAYASLDTDGSGELELDELERGLAKLGLGLTKPQLFELVTSLDTDKDGRISLAEFKSRFQLTFSRLTDEKDGKKKAGLGAKSSAEAEWAQAALKKVGQALFKGEIGANAPSVFASLDPNKDGLISEREFDLALAKLNLGYSDKDRKRIFEAVDSNASGNVNYLEFVQAFKVEDVAEAGPMAGAAWDVKDIPKEALPHGAVGKGSAAMPAPAPASGKSVDAQSPWQRAVVDKIIAVLYEYRVEMAACFNMFDTDRSGKISSKEFRVGLQALTSLTGSPITDEQADELMRALDKNGDGEIDFAEFLAGFNLEDQHHPAATA